MKENLEKRFEAAKQGMDEWISIERLSRLAPNDYVLLFPSDRFDYNYFGLKYLDTFLERVNGNKAVLLTFDQYVLKNASTFSDNIKSIINFSREQAEKLLALYSLYIFDQRFVVISLDEPYTRNALGLIGKKGITAEELIAVGVYKIIPFRRLKDNSKVM